MTMESTIDKTREYIQHNNKNACCIIAEYNPFHNGHAYLINEAKRLLNPDVLVVIMSGNYVQRGQLAIVNKWERTQMAIACGVDLIVELPSVFAVQSADIFGEKAIEIAEYLGCSTLVFGSETPDKIMFETVASTLVNIIVPQAYDKSYHERVKQVFQDMPQLRAFIETPNNILGVSYVQALKRLKSTMNYVPIARKSAQHTDTTFKSGNIASATAIRTQLLQGAGVDAYVPRLIARLLQQSRRHDINEIWPLLQYQLTVMTLDDLKSIYLVDEGLAYRIKEMVQKARSYDELVGLIETKTYRKKRVQRILLYCFFGWKDQQICQWLKQPIDQVRILGFTPIGLSYLKQQDVSYITQYKKHHLNSFWMNQITVDKLYAHFNDSEQSFRKVIR